MRGELNTRRKIKIGQNKPCQLLGHMSSNMEMESHILGTPDLRGRKNTIFIVSILFFVNVNVVENKL